MRRLVAMLIGAAVYFGWCAACWMAFPWRDHAMKAIPNETLITDTLKTVIKEPGFYVFPSATGRSEQEWRAQCVKGPTGTLIFSPDGTQPMAPLNFATGIVAAIAVSSLVGFVLLLVSRTGGTSMGRLILVSAFIGVVASLSTDVTYWNWFRFPTDFTGWSILDRVSSFTLLGAVHAWFLRGPR